MRERVAIVFMTLNVMATVFVLMGFANIAAAMSQTHYSFILWGVVQFVAAGIMLHFVHKARPASRWTQWDLATLRASVQERLAVQLVTDPR